MLWVLVWKHFRIHQKDSCLAVLPTQVLWVLQRLQTEQSAWVVATVFRAWRQTALPDELDRTRDEQRIAALVEEVPPQPAPNAVRFLFTRMATILPVGLPISVQLSALFVTVSPR